MSASEVASLVARLALDDQLTAVLAGADKAMGKLGGSVDGVANKLKGLGSLLSSLPVAAFFTGAIHEAGEAEDALAQMDAALASTSRAFSGVSKVVQVSREKLQELADQLQKTTRFSDEAVIGAESMLLTFTKIGDKVFPRAIKAIADLSTAMKQDLKGSAIQVGKALNDPIEGITALRRVGVTFSDEQERMIKNFMRTNDLASAQAVILQELETEFGGSAEAMGKTFNGQLAIMHNMISDVLESFGNALMPVLKIGISLFSQLAVTLNNMEPAFKIAILGAGLLALALSPLVAAFLPIIAVVGSMIGIMLAVDTAWKENWGGIRDAILPILTELEGAVQHFLNILFPSDAPPMPAWAEVLKNMGDLPDMPTYTGPTGLGGTVTPGKFTGPDMSQMGAEAFKTLDMSSMGTQVYTVAKSTFGENLTRAIKDAWPSIQTAITELGIKFGEWLSSALATAGPGIELALQTLNTKIGDVLNGLAAIVLTKISEALGGASDWIMNEGIPKIGEKIRELNTKIGDALNGLAAIVLNAISGALGGASVWIMNKGIPGIAEAIRGIAKEIERILGDAFGPLVKSAEKAIADLKKLLNIDQEQKLVSKTPAPGKGGGGAGFGGPDALTGGGAGFGGEGGPNPAEVGVQKVVDWLKNIGTELLKGSFVTAITTAMAAFSKAAATAIPNAVKGPIKETTEWLNTAGKLGFATVFGALASVADGKFTGVGAGLVKAVAARLLQVASIFAGLPGGIGDSYSSSIKGAVSANMRAGGGKVGPGSYIVGENGPELLDLGPGASGQVHSNAFMRGLNSGGGGGTTVVNVYNPVFQGVQDPDGMLDKLQEAAGNRNMKILNPL